MLSCGVGNHVDLRGLAFAKEWEKTHKPDVIFLVYNDHATAFSLQMIPTFAITTGPEFNPADEGYGARPVPRVIGDPETCVHIASEMIQQDFELTMVNVIEVDHGLTVPLSCVFGEVDAWPCKIIPFAVNCSTPCLRARVASRSAGALAPNAGPWPGHAIGRSIRRLTPKPGGSRPPL